LLKEPHLPQEHRERIANNYKIYGQGMQKMQEALANQTKEWSEKITKASNKTTLVMDPKAATVKL
jgi:predicted Zn-dependent protease